jgi:hypothetical protein
VHLLGKGIAVHGPLTFSRASGRAGTEVRRGRGRAGGAGHGTPAATRLLILADGYRYLDRPYGLDFSPGPMGLSRFVALLLDTPGPVRFDITLAHLDLRDGAAMMAGERRIRRRIPGFAFDDPRQFRPDGFDAVLLFSCLEKLSRDDPAGIRRLAADGTPYPVDRLAGTEIAALAAFQRGGGGLFAAGDCGRAGSLMGQHLPLAGQMRRWTARLHPGGTDPADTEPMVAPVPPPERAGAADGRPRAASPADPLPAGGDGDATGTRDGDAPDPGRGFGAEFPTALDGGPRPLPQPVRAGPPGATGLCAYDGHRAGIGRVMTAATWRPFLNASLAEFDGPPGASASETAGARPGALRGLEARCAALALWLARPGAAQRLHTRR